MKALKTIILLLCCLCAVGASAQVTEIKSISTLKENDLEVLETVVPISARLIANKASYKFKNREMELLAEKIGEVISMRETEKAK